MAPAKLVKHRTLLALLSQLNEYFKDHELLQKDGQLQMEKA
jgi:hypothetical protein